jgi:hypothetical protein
MLTPKLPMIERRHLLLAMLLLIIVLYSNALTTPFQFDDYNVIVHANGVHSWTAWWADLGHGFRPLLKLTYTLDNLSGMGGPGFHVFNILLHLANGWLVFALAYRALLLTGHERQALLVAVWTALLFIAHPAHTEAVTYISGRSTSLMSFFYLAALLLYARGRERDDRLALYVYSPLLFACAVASKETAVTLPLALLLWEALPLPRLPWSGLWRKQVMHWGVFLLLAVALLMQERYWEMMAFSVNLNSLSENFYTQLHAMTYLLGQLLLPWGMNIDPDIPVRHSFLSVLPDILLWAALLALVWWQARRERMWFFAVAWLALQLFPLYVFLPRLDVANDRQLYLADWPVLLLLVLVVASLFTQARTRNAVMILVLMFCADNTILRNQDYLSEIALWQATVRASPNKARPQNNLGYAYFLSGREAEAEIAYREALRLDKNYWRAENNLIRLHENRQ